MAAIQLFPGAGAQYSSEVFTAAAIGADEIDCSATSELGIQQIAVGSPGGTFQMQERLSSSATWFNLGTAITVGDAIVVKFTSTTRPYSRIRINANSVTGLSATVTLQMLVRGGRVAGGSTF